MAVKVLAVDDSGFFRRRISEIFSADEQIQVVDIATNGCEAIEQALALRPDVITMDYEMSLMDGATAVHSIMQRCPAPVLVFSSLTHEGARVTLDVLDIGAVDYLSKNLEDIPCNPDKIRQLSCEKVLTIAHSNRRLISLSPLPSAISSSHTLASSSSLGASARASAGALLAPASTSAAPKRKVYRLATIGTSTGGSVALQRVLTQLPANFPVPLVLIQHMPAAFIKAFAERLDKLCRISVKKTEGGDILRPGLALLAPGGKQMMTGGYGMMYIFPGDERLDYKPYVDVTSDSAAKAYNDKVLTVVLTGTGVDGREGVRLLRQGGSRVQAQDEASCAIYGMPMAVVKANLTDAMYGPDDIGWHLAEACQ